MGKLTQMTMSAKVEEVLKLFSLQQFGFDDAIIFDCGVHEETITKSNTHDNGVSVDVTLTKKVYESGNEEIILSDVEAWDMQGDWIDTGDLTDEEILKLVL